MGQVSVYGHVSAMDEGRNILRARVSFELVEKLMFYRVERFDCRLKDVLILLSSLVGQAAQEKRRMPS